MRSRLRASGTVRLATPEPSLWRDLFLEYKRRKSTAASVAPLAAVGRGAAELAGQNNWLPLGPTVVLHGQTADAQPVGGRVARLAIAPQGNIIYAATADRGVFRSADGGTSWQAMMDGFDLQAMSFASSSLSCGAIAIDRADPDRVYVGTGEADTFQLFSSRVVRALPAYRGVGPIRTDDGGKTWIAEPSAPDLAGEASSNSRSIRTIARTSLLRLRRPLSARRASRRRILAANMPWRLYERGGGERRRN